MQNNIHILNLNYRVTLVPYLIFNNTIILYAENMVDTQLANYIYSSHTKNEYFMRNVKELLFRFLH